MNPETQITDTVAVINCVLFTIGGIKNLQDLWNAHKDRSQSDKDATKQDEY